MRSWEIKKNDKVEKKRFSFKDLAIKVQKKLMDLVPFVIAVVIFVTMMVFIMNIT